MRAGLSRLLLHWVRLMRLRLQANVSLGANVMITVRGLDGTIKSQARHNMVMDAGRNLLRDGLHGNAPDLKIKWMSIGNGSTANATGMTQLVSEQMRKQPLRITDDSVTPGKLTCTFYIAPAEATSDQFTIEELGFHAGEAATESANTGVLFGRVLYHRAKSNQESIQVDYTIQLS